MFYARITELSKLEKHYESDKLECIVIYGRRRVGKTSLIRKFTEDKPTIFFSALNASSMENLESFSDAIYAHTNPEQKNAPKFQSYDDALQTVGSLAKEKRLVMVIDEYPYLAKAEKSISSRLQHLLDHDWKDTKLYLILCGSSMSFMEYQVLGYESPLYGRRTAQLKILPLTYKDVAQFNPALSCENQALIYGITGGVPHYINKLNVKSSLKSALLENVFDTSSYLYEEPENLLKQELREPAVYNSIINAIAHGASKANEISTKTGLSSAVCNKYLKVLIDLGILKRETPITEKEGKKSIYLLADQFFRFWYRFVPKNMTAIVTERFARIYDSVVGEQLPDYMGLVFEEMCKEYLLWYAQDLPFPLVDLGQWWGTDPRNKKQIQIDIVAASVNPGEYLIGSCKYKNTEIGMEELLLLREYAAAFGKGTSYQYYIFSKSGFTKELLAAQERQEVRLVTLQDLYD